MAEYEKIIEKVTKESKWAFLDDFETISLDQMNAVRLLNRFDAKYWFDAKYLTKILSAIKDDYYVLEIAHEKIQSYRTVYFDTPNDKLYIAHHNGKSNRIKVRKREYVDSNLSFLEIKHKNNKGKTKKDRMPIPEFQSDFSLPEKQFIQNNSFLNPDELEIKFGNVFKRITLVNKNFKERCTIDINLKFHSFGTGNRTFKNLVIIELKQGARNMKSTLSEVLRQNKIYEQSFSKYCIGRALNETSLKRNRFKPDILKIEKQLTHE